MLTDLFNALCGTNIGALAIVTFIADGWLRDCFILVVDPERRTLPMGAARDDHAAWKGCGIPLLCVANAAQNLGGTTWPWPLAPAKVCVCVGGGQAAAMPALTPRSFRKAMPT